MTALSDVANTGTTRVRDGYGFDEDALTAWMTAHVTGFKGPLSVQQFRGGQSNPTYKLSTPGEAYVLRRKPPGRLLKGAHAIEREAKVIAGLALVDFPDPRIHALCTDGRIFWDATLPPVPASDKPAYFAAMNATLATLHMVDFEAVGLRGYGRADNYLARQIDRWSRQYVDDVDAGRDPNMDRLIEWLPAHLPKASAASIVHGDPRIDNMVFHPTEPRVVALLDWELSTLGDPLADFTYNAMMFHTPPHLVAGLAGADLRALNIPSEADYVDAYCARTGRAAIDDYHFYLAFNFFRLAAIFHGICGRVRRGTAVSANAGSRAQAFPELAAIAWQQARSA